MFLPARSGQPIFQAQSIREPGLWDVYSPTDIPDWPITRVYGEELTNGNIRVRLNLSDPEGGPTIFLVGDITPRQYEAIKTLRRLQIAG